MEISDFSRLKEKLLPVLSIEEDYLQKIVEEVFNFYTETYETFVIRRHQELKKQGYKNNIIYEIIRNELKNRLFRACELSERQIRRIIYS